MTNKQMIRANNRLSFISFLQLFGILLVVVGHSFHEYPVDNGVSTLAYRLIYSFHMPLFMWISGFLFDYSMKSGQSYGKFVWSKFQRLIIPYLFLSAITFIPRAAMSGMADTDIDFSLGSFFKSLLLYDDLVIPFFWFLQALFIIMNVGFGISRLKANGEMLVTGLLIVISIIIAILGIRYKIGFFSLGNAAYFMMYFLFGYLCSKNFARMKPVLDNTFILCLLLSLWLYSGMYGNNSVFFEIVAAVTGTFASVSLSMKISKYISNYGIFEGTSYIIFLLSWYPGVVCQQVLHHFTQWDWWVYSILAVIFSILVPVGIYRFLINRSKKSKVSGILLFLLGHKKITRHLDEQSL